VQESKHGVNQVPAVATLAVGAVFALSGFFNVVLLLTTRPEAKLFGGMAAAWPLEPQVAPAVPLQPIPPADQEWLP
jgi:hypothetical protein